MTRSAGLAAVMAIAMSQPMFRRKFEREPTDYLPLRHASHDAERIAKAEAKRAERSDKRARSRHDGARSRHDGAGVQAMTREEKLALLRQWEASYLELDLQMDRLSAVVGSMVHSPFGEAVWGAWDNYTRALAELVGDGYEWLNWYCFDNDMGKKAYEAGWEGDMRPITQAADLLWLIEGGGGDKEATWAEA